MVSSKTTATTVRLPNEVMALVRRFAAETGKSQSQVVTDVLAEWARKIEQEKRS